MYCKVSGMVTEADWQHWQTGHFRPYLDSVFRAFGTHRVMFGTDWPVCTVAASYRQVTEIATGYVRRFAEAERLAVMAENAIRFYGLRMA